MRTIHPDYASFPSLILQSTFPTKMTNRATCCMMAKVTCIVSRSRCSASRCYCNKVVQQDHLQNKLTICIRNVQNLGSLCSDLGSSTECSLYDLAREHSSHSCL